MRYKLIIILIITIAAFLRFYNLNNIGPIFYDEGQYISESVYVKDILIWSSNLVSKLPFSNEKAKLIDQNVRSFKTMGQALKTGRPVHNLITTTGLFLMPQKLIGGNFILAGIGVVNILLTYLLAYKITSSRFQALIAAAILAVLPLHIFYSRLVMAEVDSQFFFLIALIFYILRVTKNKRRYFILTAIFIVIALMTNGDRIAFLSPLIVEVIAFQKKALKNILIFIFLLILGIFFAELPYHLAFLLTHNYYIPITNPTYIEQQLWIMARLGGFGARISLLSFFSYPYMIINTTGYLFFILAFIGIINSLRSSNRSLRMITWFILITYIFQSIHALQALRATSAILPLLAIEAAVGISFIYKLLYKFSFRYLVRSLLIVCLLLFIFGELLINAIPVIKYKSTYPNLISFLKTNQAKTIVTTDQTITNALAPGIDAINYQVTLGNNNLLPLSSKKPDFIVLSFQKYTIPTKALDLTLNLDTTTKLIEKNCQPIYYTKQFNNPEVIKFFAFEHNSHINKTYEFLNNLNNFDNNIKVYSYKTCMNKISNFK